jgi:hypothetical protein
MAEPMSREEQLDLLVAQGRTREEAEAYLDQVQTTAATVTPAEVEASRAKARAELGLDD